MATLHCWTCRREWLEARYGFHSEQHLETYSQDFIDGTCMLPAGHAGPHDFTPDHAIRITFSDKEPPHADE